jgi:hypothetical protein
MRGEAPSADAAVAATFYDTSKWPLVRQLNELRDRTRRRYRPSGAGLLSAVILVSIEYEPGWPPKRNRVAKWRLILNREAKYPLTSAQLASLKTLDLNKIEYGPQSETWSPLGRRERRDMTKPLRREVPGKSIKYRLLGDGEFELGVPAEDLVSLLAGQYDAREHADWLETFGDLLSQRPDVKSVRFERGDPKLRQPDTVYIVMTRRSAPILQVPRNEDRPEPESRG